jgi:hypothetical protein
LSIVLSDADACLSQNDKSDGLTLLNKIATALCGTKQPYPNTAVAEAAITAALQHQPRTAIFLDDVWSGHVRGCQALADLVSRHPSLRLVLSTRTVTTAQQLRPGLIHSLVNIRTEFGLSDEEARTIVSNIVGATAGSQVFDRDGTVLIASL